MQIRQNKRQLIISLLFGFLAGIFYANFAAKSFSTVTGVFQESFIQQYAGMEIVVEDYIPYLFKIRVIPALCLAFAGCTQLKKPAVFMMLLGTGFSAGVVSVVSVLRFGVRGILFCIAGMFPQFLFYILGYAVLLWHLFRYPHSQWNMAKTGFMAIMMIAGIITEAYINPIIVKWVLEIIT